MIDLTIVVINTVNFGTVQLNNNPSQLEHLKSLNNKLGVPINILINGYDSIKGREAEIFYLDNYPEFNIIKSPETVPVGKARQILWDSCNTEWVIYNDEDDDFIDDCIEKLTAISDQIDRSPKDYDLVINKFNYVKSDGSLEWTSPDWYIEDQILRTSNFAMYHGSSYALVGSFINKKRLSDLKWPDNSGFSEDLLTALYLYKKRARAAYTTNILTVCNSFNSTLTVDKVKTDAENDLDDLSGIFPIYVTRVLK